MEMVEKEEEGFKVLNVFSFFYCLFVVVLCLLALSDFGLLRRMSGALQAI